MKHKNITVSWTEYTDISELQKTDADLVEAARVASDKAYAPYSGFNVGAALRLENGEILTGTNVENAAFPSGICAERNVLSAFASNHNGKKAVAMAIAAKTADGLTDEPVPPCGNCRQVITEEETRSGNTIRIILSGSKKIIILEKGSDLLPLQFDSSNLRPGRRG